LLQQHYNEICQDSTHNLSFAEKVAIHFPEGRTLAEKWEIFWAEHLANSSHTPLTYNKQEFFKLKNSWEWSRTNILANDNKLFKLYPDEFGYDIIYWQVENRQITINVYQLKVGKCKYYIDYEKLGLLTESRCIGKLVKTFTDKFSRNIAINKYLVTTKLISDPNEKKLKLLGVTIINSTSQDSWGPRVNNYCINNRFTLWQ